MDGRITTLESNNFIFRSPCDNSAMYLIGIKSGPRLLVPYSITSKHSLGRVQLQQLWYVWMYDPRNCMLHARSNSLPFQSWDLWCRSKSSAFRGMAKVPVLAENYFSVHYFTWPYPVLSTTDERNSLEPKWSVPGQGPHRACWPDRSLESTFYTTKQPRTEYLR